MPHEPRVVLIGATGYTGRLVAAELQRQGLPFLLTARDPGKLDALAATVGEPPTRVVDVYDEAGRRAAIGPGDVVLSCAGPFLELGEPVVRAAVEAGAHYLDTTGEQPFMLRVLERFDGAAREAGSTVVNGMAYEYALGDCGAALVAAGLAPPLRSLDVVYAWAGTGGSRGTRRTALRMIEVGGFMRVDGELRQERLGARRRRVTLPGGREVAALSFTCGEVLTVPRHTPVSDIRGWLVASRRTARLANLLAPVLPFVVRVVRPIAEQWLRRSPDGPAPERRRADTFTILLEAVGADGAEARLAIRGRDAYGLTAAIMVLGARTCLAGAPAGVLAASRLVPPDTLFGALADRGIEEVSLD